MSVASLDAGLMVALLMNARNAIQVISGVKMIQNVLQHALVDNTLTMELILAEIVESKIVSFVNLIIGA